MAKNSARASRQSGKVPAVVYGHGVDPIPLSVDSSELLKTYREAGTSALLDLDVDGKMLKVLIHDLTLHPVKNTIYHVDFFAVNLKERTTVEVPLEFVGVAPAVKDLGGIFMKEQSSLSIRCLPTEIPHEITVDISVLKNIHDHVTIADLDLDSEKYEVMGLEPGSVLCSVVERMAEIVEEEPVEVGEGEEGEETEGEGEGEAGESEDEAEGKKEAEGE